ncbi:hypothetical protein [Yimella sp. NH-Cas1]|uniref:hypothetical protein n=1 Tax=Yimella sp. NH-Cas1 TaxID=2917726 RepID=UPI001EFBF647|nr:hypothetical protein [Yimella sp. NH-Cas1]MCG8654619.1 hypothetical protein [Yimella sp. NH-Cas1]
MSWGNVIPLLLFTAVIVAVLFVAVPRARRNRHKVWEDAGLMPHQIDHEAPSGRTEDAEADDPGRDRR